MVTNHHPGLEQLLGTVGEAMTTPVLVLRCVERLLWPGPNVTQRPGQASLPTRLLRGEADTKSPARMR